MVLAWENLWRFLFIFVHFVVAIAVHLSSFVNVFHFVGVVTLFDFQATLPCHRHSTLASQTRHFNCLFFFIYRERYGFDWAFFTHRHFLPYTPSQHFWYIPTFLAQPAFIKVLLGARSYFLESCRAPYWSSKHRPGPSVCLIHSTPQSFIHLKSVFIHVNIAKVLLVVKTLIRSAATLFSNHENIKQQPN